MAQKAGFALVMCVASGLGAQHRKLAVALAVGLID
jgi:hypothetical protein